MIGRRHNHGRTSSGSASPGRFRRAATPLLAALLTGAAGVATNRVQGGWKPQALFFTISVVCIFVAARFVATEDQGGLQPRKVRKARQRIVTKALPGYYRHEKPVWLDGALPNELPIPAQYEPLNCDPRESQERRFRNQMTSSVLDAYGYSGGQLLILGDAGSGKTHALFQIIEDTLAKCEKDENCPIPFYVDLASWDGGSGDLGRWCVSHISDRYRISEDLIKYWLNESDISLMFDGLDEIPRKARVACVSAINRFRQQNGLVSIVVASRSQEYSDTRRRLQLHGCLRLNPLSVTALLSELASIAPDISESVAKDSRLRDLLRVPLFLNLFVQAYKGGSSVKQVQRRRSWRYTIIDEYLEQAERRGASRFGMVDMGLRSWLPPVIQKMKQQHQAVIYPDRLPLEQLDSDLKSQAEHQTALITTAIVAFVMLAVRIPALIAIRNDAGFPGFIIGTAMVVPVVSFGTWKYCRMELAKPIVFRYRFKKGTRTQVFINWALLFGGLNAFVTLYARFQGSGPLFLVLAFGAAAVTSYPFFGLMRRKEPDADRLPRYPGEETRSLVSFNLTITGIIAACISAGMFAIDTPLLYVSDSLSRSASAYIIPYFLVPFTLVAWIGSGGASVIYIFVARNVQKKLGLLPAKYMTSFRALRSSSILVPAGGGYSVVHSLVRDHLAAQTEHSNRKSDLSTPSRAKLPRPT
jgi:hypothetical protein